MSHHPRPSPTDLSSPPAQHLRDILIDIATQQTDLRALNTSWEGIRSQASVLHTSLEEIQRLRTALEMRRSASSSSALPGQSPNRGDSYPVRTRFKYNQTASVLVGEKQTHFVVHRELLTSNSPFFAAALNGSFMEATTQTVKLPIESVTTFEYFVSWLYRGANMSALDPLTEDFYKDGKPTYFSLLELYALADRLNVEGLRNAVVDKMAELSEKTNSVLTPSDTWILYDNIRDSAPVRQLVLDLFAYKKTDNLLATHQDEWHPTFLRDLCVRLKKADFSAISRHMITPWTPTAWTATKACSICTAVLRPHLTHGRCETCRRGFCNQCYDNGIAVPAFDFPRDGGCKPWKRGGCEGGYHEHVDTEQCPPWAPDNAPIVLTRPAPMPTVNARSSGNGPRS